MARKIVLVGTALCLLTIMGCEPQVSTDAGVFVIGRRGIDQGHFSKPRAITVDEDDNIYVVDMTGRIQVFSCEGQFLRYWNTPEIRNGKPCGLGISNDGMIMVADTHYFRVLFYTKDGELIPGRTIGGENGRGPGQFGFVTDVVQDSVGNYYVADYGDYDRIQKFDSAGSYLFEWGGHGSEKGQFLRPQALALDEDDHLWVADACNHRIQIFDATSNPPKLISCWGQEGTAPGQIRYPYGIWLGSDRTVYLAEFGNHRVQRFTRDGQSLGVFGRAGRGLGEFHQPWSLCLDSLNRIFVLDSYNHRVQRFEFPAADDGR